MIRDVLPVLSDAWKCSDGTEAPSARLLRHSDAFTLIVDRAATLVDQADSHARDFSGAIANTPKPAEFEAVRARLQQALEANAKFPGRFTPLVSSLIAQQGELRQQAVNCQTEYHGQTETSTGQLAAALPSMVPGLLGAVGGMLGGAISTVAQVPQALLQTGQQLAQAATQGLSGLATSPASGFDSATTGLDAGSPGAGLPGAPPESGATSPAGARETTPVAPSTSSSSPPPATTLPTGGQPASAPPTGSGAVPMGMPMAMGPSTASTQANTKVAGDKKIVVPVAPHTEPVTGRTAPERLAGRRRTEDEFS